MINETDLVEVERCLPKHGDGKTLRTITRLIAEVRRLQQLAREGWLLLARYHICVNAHEPGCRFVQTDVQEILGGEE